MKNERNTVGSKGIETEVVFTKSEMNIERNAVCSKSIETEAIFTKTKMSDE